MPGTRIGEHALAPWKSKKEFFHGALSAVVVIGVPIPILILIWLFGGLH